MVYDVLRKAVNDPDFVLERIVPKDPSSFKQYLSYLYGMEDLDFVLKIAGLVLLAGAALVWPKKISR